MYVGRTSWAYYNEIDEYAAQWIENLIGLGLVAPGVVDRRSIEDVRPDDLRGFRQCHFFAGIGVWSYALRGSGVPDDAAVWTGSCPCQPFSAAGQGAGVDDERHLWPAFFHLIDHCRPPRIYGEQVASKDGLGWLDLVLADMEASDYAIWAVDTPSAGSGAPHIRQRLRFCADDLRSSTGYLVDSNGTRSPSWLSKPSQWQERHSEINDNGGYRLFRPGEGGPVFNSLDGRIDWVADNSGGRFGVLGDALEQGRGRHLDGSSNAPGIVADPIDGYLSQSLGRPERRDGSTATHARTAPNRPSPTNAFWSDADWLFCRDGKWRPVEPESFPLVDGATFRVGSGSPFEGKSRQGMLKGYGNAVDAQATIDFIEATLDTVDAVVGSSMKCPCCEKEADEIERRRMNTAYVDDDSNWMISCLPCFDEMEEYWQERWDDYNRGRL